MGAVKNHREPPKYTPADRTREIFYQLILDWVYLHQQLPRPAVSSHAERRANREYGHPAEWAADKAAQIAGILTDWHDLMADHRGETRPANKIMFGSDLARTQFDFVIEARLSEQKRVVAAWNYLEPRFDQLCQLVAAEAFTEIHDLHHGIQRTLGYSNPPVMLPMPCPNAECGLRTLQRHLAAGNDSISCACCGYQVRDDPEGANYKWLIRVCLDTLIEAA